MLAELTGWGPVRGCRTDHGAPRVVWLQGIEGIVRYDPIYTAAYYDSYAAKEGARWERSPRARLERALYQHHISQRVRKGDRVLDAGCGPGTFTRHALELGARVTCLDLSRVQLDACRSEAPGAEEYVQGSITDLSMFEDDQFDVTLALGGPVSYCLDRAEDAVRELRRVTRTGGVVGLSVMNLYGTVHRFLPGVLQFPLEVNERVLRTGDLDRAMNDGHECHMYRVDELLELLQRAGLKEVELHASGWLVPNGDIELPDPESEEWRMLFEAELVASAETPGAGTHILAWARV